MKIPQGYLLRVVEITFKDEWGDPDKTHLITWPYPELPKTEFCRGAKKDDHVIESIDLDLLAGSSGPWDVSEIDANHCPPRITLSRYTEYDDG